MSTCGFSIHATARVLLSAALLTVFLSATSQEAFASPITFELQNVTFEGGGSLSGSVTIDPAGPGGGGWPISFVNIVTDPGGSSLPSLTFAGNPGYAPNQVGYDPGYLSMWVYTGDYNLQLSIPYADSWTFPAPFNISAQTYQLHTDQDTYPYTGSHIFYCSGTGCVNGIANFNITGGSLVPTEEAVSETSTPLSIVVVLLTLAFLSIRAFRI